MSAIMLGLGRPPACRHRPPRPPLHLLEHTGMCARRAAALLARRAHPPPAACADRLGKRHCAATTGIAAAAEVPGPRFAHNRLGSPEIEVLPLPAHHWHAAALQVRKALLVD